MAAMDRLNQAMGAQPPAGQPRPGGRGQQPPGTEDLSPEQLEQIERVSVLAQAVLADEQSGGEIVQQASTGPEGIFQATSAILKMVTDKMELPREMIIPAAVTILIIIVKFLADIGKADASPYKLGHLIGGMTAIIGTEYGFSPEEINEMTGQMPTEGGMRQGAVQQRAKQGPIGAMMQRAQPQEGV